MRGERASMADLFRALWAELQKSRRRWDGVVCLLAVALIWVWAGQRPETPAQAADGYSRLLFVLPLVHAVVMPVSAAVLASRLWDCEIRADSFKLLYTLQSRRSLFAAKSLLGMGEVTLLTGAEFALIPVAGRVLGFTQELEGGTLAWLGLCTWSVNGLLFFAASLLLVVSRGPVLTLCAGVAASLTGIFTAYMPLSMSYLVPWGYFLPLSSIRMDWDRVTRISTYSSRGYDLPLLAWTLVLAAGLAAACWHTIREKEV